MERSEKSERSAFFYPEGRTYSPLRQRKLRFYHFRINAKVHTLRCVSFFPQSYALREPCFSGGIACGERRSCRGLVKFVVLICRIAELQPFHDCVALMLSMQNESRSFTRLSEKNLLRIFFSAMDGQ